MTDQAVALRERGINGETCRAKTKIKNQLTRALEVTLDHTDSDETARDGALELVLLAAEGLDAGQNRAGAAVPVNAVIDQ